jgi:hypothetical protein
MCFTDIFGQQYEVKLIQFITRYGYATRPNPYCKLHEAYPRYTNMPNATYIIICDDVNRIIPITMFLVMLFNACFMYQPEKDTNLLILALNNFAYRRPLVTNDTFMNIISKLFTRIKLYKFRIICILKTFLQTMF